MGALATAGVLAGCAPHAKGEVAGADAATGATSDGALQTVDWLGEAPEISDDDCIETLECEVLVIGAGTSGYFAAASAAESGAKTLLIEKSSVGSSVRSSALGAVNSRLQREQGAKAAIVPMEIANDMDRYAIGQINASLVRAWALNSGETLDWYTDLMARNGIEVQLEWNMPDGTFYKDWPTGHGTNGEYPSREQDVAKVIDAYISSFDGCEVRFNCAMKRLIEEDGRVLGAYAEVEEGMVRINASKGVVVATGGYAYNQDMYLALQPCATVASAPSMRFLLARVTASRRSCGLVREWMRCPLLSRSIVACSLPNKNMAIPMKWEVISTDTTSLHHSRFCAWMRTESGSIMKCSLRFRDECDSPTSLERTLLASGVGRQLEERCPPFSYCGLFHYLLQPEGGSDHDAFPGQLDEWIEPEMEQFVEAGFW